MNSVKRFGAELISKSYPHAVALTLRRGSGTIDIGSDKKFRALIRSSSAQKNNLYRHVMKKKKKATKKKKAAKGKKRR